MIRITRPTADDHKLNQFKWNKPSASCFKACTTPGLSGIQWRHAGKNGASSPTSLNTSTISLILVAARLFEAGA